MFRLLTVLCLGLLLGCKQEAPVPPDAAGGTPDTTLDDSGNAEGSPNDVPGLTGAPSVNLNTATREQFLALPEVSEKMAHEFDEYRPYASIRQFRREIGKYVDEDQVARYEKHVYVPIDVNESDAETLRQIPGLDQAGAEAIIAARPFDSGAAFLDALSSHVDMPALEIARSFLSE